jgi:hypothetical protein
MATVSVDAAGQPNFTSRNQFGIRHRSHAEIVKIFRFNRLEENAAPLYRGVALQRQSRSIPAFAYGPGLLTALMDRMSSFPSATLLICASVYALTAAETLR